LLLLLSAGLVWATYFELDEVTTVTGKVIPSSRGQVVQILEAGVLRELSVKEGDSVDKNQILLKLDDSRAGPVYQEAYRKWKALLARATRLRAEAYDAPLDFPKAVLTDAELVSTETQALAARRSALDHQVEALERQLVPLTREIALTAPLVRQGLVSEVELLRLDRQAAELKGQIATARANFFSRAIDELVLVDTELNQISESLVGYRAALDRTIVYSPADGIVRAVNVSTVGAVINAGQVIMDIVPVNDDLIVEVFMPPSEVAYVQVGQSAQVKLSAYDDRRYGSLDGVVELIGPDVVIEDNKGGARLDGAPVNFEPGFYRVFVCITNPGIERNGVRLEPKVGMTATVDILTGNKTVMEYIFNPAQALRNALRER
jgi:adhesin transport system membrane fusion protein